MSILFVTLHAQQEQEKINMSKKVLKSDTEWATCLTPEEYKVLREKGTEMAFTGKYYNHKEDGTYTCAGCDYELFSSETKFDSKTGWPSFFQALDKENYIIYNCTKYRNSKSEIAIKYDDENFTYYCFKKRIKDSEPAKLASDTKKGTIFLQELMRSEEKRLALSNNKVKYSKIY